MEGDLEVLFIWANKHKGWDNISEYWNYSGVGMSNCGLTAKNSQNTVKNYKICICIDLLKRYRLTTTFTVEFKRICWELFKLTPLFNIFVLQVVANAVAAISEILDTSPSAQQVLEMTSNTINKLLTALNECTE